MAKDLMNYNSMVKNALRGVIRESLAKIAQDGLPGSHHLYVKFRTDFPGVEMADWLKEKHPTEIVIVLQHQFWGLAAHEEHFEISLNFNKVPEHLVVPYLAVSSFYDPSVQFGLDFENSSAAEPAAAETPAEKKEPALPAKRPETKSENQKPDEDDKKGDDKDGGDKGGGDKDGNVVTLDAFRKK